MVDLMPSIINDCPKCRKAIRTPDKYYYRGEVIKCPHCNTRLIASNDRGILKFVEGSPSVGEQWKIARILEFFAVRKRSFLTYNVVYFDDEGLARKYGSAIENMGSVKTPSGDMIDLGRSPEYDYLTDSGYPMYACTK